MTREETCLPTTAILFLRLLIRNRARLNLIVRRHIIIKATQDFVNFYGLGENGAPIPGGVDIKDQILEDMPIPASAHPTSIQTSYSPVSGNGSNNVSNTGNNFDGIKWWSISCHYSRTI